jgi:hypothetical protein
MDAGSEVLSVKQCSFADRRACLSSARTNSHVSKYGHPALIRQAPMGAYRRTPFITPFSKDHRGGGRRASGVCRKGIASHRIP